MPKSSKKVVKDESDFDDDDDKVVAKKTKIEEVPASDATASSTNTPTNTPTNTSIVKAAPTSIVSSCTLEDKNNRMQKLLGSFGKAKAPVNPMGNNKKNYAHVRGVIVSIGKVTHEAKKVIDGKAQSVKFIKYNLCVAVQSLQPISSAGLVYGGPTDDPACNFAVPSKIVAKDGKQDMEPDHRFAPEVPRFITMSAPELSFDEKQEPDKNAWFQKTQIGTIIEATVELKIKKGGDVATSYIDMSLLKVTPRSGSNPADYNPSATALKTLFTDERINATAYDTMVDMCGGMLAFRYGASAENMPYLDPSILHDPDMSDKLEEIKRHENYDQMETLEFNARIAKRREILSKEIKRLPSNFHEGTDPSAAQAYNSYADDLAASNIQTPLHKLLNLPVDKDAQSLLLMHTDRLSGLFDPHQAANLPNRFMDWKVQHIEIPKSFTAIQFSAVACGNTRKVVEHLTNDVEVNLPRTQLSCNDDTPVSRVTIKVENSRLAGIFGTRSTSHLQSAIKVLLPNSDFCIKTSIKDPQPVSTGIGCFEERYAESMIVDVPAALIANGIPVSPEWVKTNLRKGTDFYKGLAHVEKADSEYVTEMTGDYKSKTSPITEITSRGFINLTEYKGEATGDENPLYNAPMDTPVRMVVVLDDPSVKEWYDNIRTTQGMSLDQMASDGDGEKFLESIFEAEKKDNKKSDASNSINEFMLKHNAIVFAVLENKKAEAMQTE